ncbi:15863_t:CDS:1, partial [Cetraspora pellucida]
LLGCGCSKDQILDKRKKIAEYRPSISNKRLYHCCNCIDIIYVDDIVEQENNKFLCKRCNKDFLERLPNNDRRKIEYMQSSEYQKDIVKCVVCEKDHHHFHFVEGAGNFCNIEHQIAYLVSKDIENPNKHLWTRIIHRTESTKTKMSAYSLNQTAILRTVLKFRKEINISYEEALDEQAGDIWNTQETTDDTDDWYSDDYRFTRVINNLNIPLEQELEKQRLRKLIVESFDFSSNIDIEEILNSLYDRFGGNLQNITFCK